MIYHSRVIETEPPTDWQVRPEPRPTSVNGSYRAHAIDYVDRFHDLVRRWRLETAYSSSVMEKITNPVFQQIVHMGPKVSKLIVEELRIRRDFLFMALALIHSDEDPVPSSAIGKPHEMINAWLTWAERQRAYAI